MEVKKIKSDVKNLSHTLGTFKSQTENDISVLFRKMSENHLDMSRQISEVVAQLAQCHTNGEVIEDIKRTVREELHSGMTNTAAYQSTCWSPQLQNTYEVELQRLKDQLCQEQCEHQRDKEAILNHYTANIQGLNTQLQSEKQLVKSLHESETSAHNEAQRLRRKLEDSHRFIEQLEGDLQTSIQNNTAQQNTITSLQHSLEHKQEQIKQQEIACQQQILLHEESARKQHIAGGEQTGESSALRSLAASFLPSMPSWSGSKNKPKESTLDSYREMIERRNSEIKGLQNEVAEKNKTLAKASAKVKEQAHKITRLTAELVKYQHEECGEAVADKCTHSKLLSEYEALFTTKKQSTRRALESTGTQHQVHFDKILSRMFPVLHKECKAAALQMMFQDLYRPHKDGEDTTLARKQARIYGELLQLAQAIPPPIPCILQMAEGSIQQLGNLRARAKQQSIPEVEEYLMEFVKLAWKMVTINPPMIADQPSEFDENLHDKHFGEWKIESGPYDLVYLRPVLYNSYRDCIPASKATVGNKHTHPKYEH